MTEETVCVAVVGIVLYKRQCLFLKRNDPPYNWCPPCGGLRGRFNRRIKTRSF